MAQSVAKLGLYTGTSTEPDGLQLKNLTTAMTLIGRKLDIIEDFCSGPAPANAINGSLPHWPQYAATYGFTNYTTNISLLFSNSYGSGNVAAAGQTWAAVGANNFSLNLQAWKDQFNAVKPTYPSALLRFNHEFNANSYCWDAYNDVTASPPYSNFIGSWQAAANAARAISPTFVIVYNPASFGTTSSGGTTLDGPYPGDAYVDMVGIDWYDAVITNLTPGLARWAAQYNGFYGGWQDGMNFFGNHMNKPLCFPEWGCGSDLYYGVNNNGFYMKNMRHLFEWLGPRVDHQICFSFADGSYAVPGDYLKSPWFSDEYLAAFGPRGTPTRSTGKPTKVQASTGVMANTTGNGVMWSLQSAPVAGNKVLAIVAVDNNAGGILWGTATWEAVGVYPISATREIRVFVQTVSAALNQVFNIGVGNNYRALISLVEIANLHDVAMYMGALGAGGAFTYKASAELLALGLFQWDANSPNTPSPSVAGSLVTSGNYQTSPGNYVGGGVVDLSTPGITVQHSALNLSNIGSAIVLLSGLTAAQATTPPSLVQSQSATGNTLTLNQAPVKGNTLVAFYCSDSNSGVGNVTPPVGWRQRANANDTNQYSNIAVASIYVTDPANMGSVTFQNCSSTKGILTVFEVSGPVDVECVHGMPFGGPGFGSTSVGSYNFVVQSQPANALTLGAICQSAYSNGVQTYVPALTSGTGTVYGSGYVSGGIQYIGSSVFGIPPSTTSVVATGSGANVQAIQCAVITVTPA